MFYDNFSEEQICGIFTPWHFVAIFAFFALAVLAIFFSRKLNKKQSKIILWVIAFLVTIMEIIKIAIRLYKGEGGDGWIPLYYCSLFIYAIWLSLSNNKHLKRTGQCFMVLGGILASVCYIIYPSTSLLLYPIWHPASLHSLFYHWLMLYAGVLILMKGQYEPKIKDFFYYLIFTTFFTIIAVIINHYLGTNLMFMGNPFGLDFLNTIFDFLKPLYMLIVYLAQCVLLFFATFGIYELVKFILNRRKLAKKESKR